MSQRYKKELKVNKDPVGFFSAFGFLGIPNILLKSFFPQEFIKLGARSGLYTLLPVFHPK